MIVLITFQRRFKSWLTSSRMFLEEASLKNTPLNYLPYILTQKAQSRHNHAALGTILTKEWVLIMVVVMTGHHRKACIRKWATGHITTKGQKLKESGQSLAAQRHITIMKAHQVNVPRRWLLFTHIVNL